MSIDHIHMKHHLIVQESYPISTLRCPQSSDKTKQHRYYQLQMIHSMSSKGVKRKVQVIVLKGKRVFATGDVHWGGTPVLQVLTRGLSRSCTGRRILVQC